MLVKSERSEAFSSNSYTEFTLFYERKKDDRGVNIFHKRICHLTL